MKVLLTGAAGFIGSNLLHYLAKERPKWSIVALDNLGYAGNLENIDALLKQNKQLQFVRGDITDRALILDLFKQHSFELVFHLAAESHVDRSIEGAITFVNTNVVGTQNLVDGARSCNARFVHISTDEVYGSLGETGSFVETTPLDPSSPYSASKAASDLLVLAAHRTNGLWAVVTRCTNNYGPYQFPEKFIPLFILNTMQGKKLPLYGDGTNVRSWLHVLDHCRGLLLAAEQGRAGEVYNIGGSSSAERPNKEVALRIIDLLGQSPELLTLVSDRPGHDWRYSVDYTKANRELGWAPQVSFEEGLKETVEWYVQNQDWWKRIQDGEYRRFYEQNYGSRLAAN